MAPHPQATVLRLLRTLGGLVAVVAVAGVAVAGGAAPSTAGVLVVVGAIVVLAGSMLLALPRDGRRVTVARWTAAGAVVVIAGVPATAAIAPGRSAASGELRKVGDEILLPRGVGGRLRLLVSGSLPGESMAGASYVVTINGERIEGTFERTIRSSWKKMGRFTNEHSSEYHALRAPLGARALALERLDGPLTDGLRVRVFREYVPAWLIGAFMAGALALAAFVDAAGKHQGVLAAYAGMALLFGALTRSVATPAATFSTIVVSLVLGVPFGAAAGLAVSVIARASLRRR